MIKLQVTRCTVQGSRCNHQTDYLYLEFHLEYHLILIKTMPLISSNLIFILIKKSFESPILLLILTFILLCLINQHQIALFFRQLKCLSKIPGPPQMYHKCTTNVPISRFLCFCQKKLSFSIGYK